MELTTEFHVGPVHVLRGEGEFGPVFRASCGRCGWNGYEFVFQRDAAWQAEQHARRHDADR